VPEKEPQMNASVREAKDLPAIELLPPEKDGGASVLAALTSRQTIREIAPKPLPPQLLSNLLWAAWGVNREHWGPFGASGRTAASASNSQEIELFVATKDAAYRYDGTNHWLVPVVAGDWRGSALTPHQRNVDARAPVQLIFVADIHRLTHTQGFEEPGLHDPEVQKSYYFVDTGLIAGNVYLFAAAEGLAAWFHNCDKTRLHRALGLNTEQRVLFAQSVGYPENP
jgi:nitroreductase